MTNSALTVVVGLAAILAVLGTLASGALRIVQRNTNAHGKELRRSIGVLLDDTEDPDADSLTERLYATPEIRALTRQPGVFRRSARAGDHDERAQRPRCLPDYIPPQVFTDATVELIPDEQPTSRRPSQRESPLISVTGKVEREELKPKVKSVYEVEMHAATERFRVRTRWGLFLIGVLFAVVGNIDSIELAQSLWEDEQVRHLVDHRIESCNSDAETCITTSSEVRQQVRLPIGWVCEEPATNGESIQVRTVQCAPWDSIRESFPESIPGWLLTALGISLGAPVWFDLIRRIRTPVRAA
jgi:hypothetical protein